MVYEEKSLEELMEMARTARGEEPEMPGMDIFEDDLLLDNEHPTVDIEACVAETLEKLKDFRLTQEEQQTVEEFLTFHLQIRQRANKGRWMRPAFYNLMLVAPEQEMAVRMAKILQDALQIRLPHAVCCRKRRMPDGRSGSSATPPSPFPRFLWERKC